MRRAAASVQMACPMSCKYMRRALSASSASVATASASSSGTAGSHIMPRYTASASSSSVPAAPMTK